MKQDIKNGVFFKLKNAQATDKVALKALFEEFGSVKELKVETKRGHGRVFFEDESSATKCINKSEIAFGEEGKVLVQALKETKPKEKKRNKSTKPASAEGKDDITKTLYVSPCESVDQVKQALAVYGTITSVVVKRKKGAKPYGFVTFESDSCFEKILADSEKGEGIVVGEQKLSVARRRAPVATVVSEPAKANKENKENTKANKSEPVKNVVYVSGFEYAVTDEDLKAACESFGKVENIAVTRREGIVSVKFNTPEEMKAARNVSYEIEGVALNVEEWKSERPYAERMLHVSGFDKTKSMPSEEVLLGMFKPHGTVEKINVRPSQTSCRVTFESPSSAAAVIQAGKLPGVSVTKINYPEPRKSNSSRRNRNRK